MYVPNLNAYTFWNMATDNGIVDVLYIRMDATNSPKLCTRANSVPANIPVNVKGTTMRLNVYHQLSPNPRDASLIY